MKIHHLGLWASDLEALKDFYVKVLGLVAGPLYHNPKTGFSSYFLSLGEGCRIELMNRADMYLRERIGHFALEVGPPSRVDQVTEDLRAQGLRVVSEPRVTGDGYYESCFLDPEGNRVELMATPGDLEIED